MRVVVTKAYSLCFFLLAWAVRNRSAPSVGPAVPATTAATVQVQAVNSASNLLQSGGHLSPTGQPLEAKPLT